MTTREQQVLSALSDGPSVVAELFDIGSKDAVRARLRRLEDRGLVRRLYLHPGAATWELTHAGRAALQLTT